MTEQQESIEPKRKKIQWGCITPIGLIILLIIFSTWLVGSGGPIDKDLSDENTKKVIHYGQLFQDNDVAEILYKRRGGAMGMMVQDPFTTEKVIFRIKPESLESISKKQFFPGTKLSIKTNYYEGTSCYTRLILDKTTSPEILELLEYAKTYSKDKSSRLIFLSSPKNNYYFLIDRKTRLVVACLTDNSGNPEFSD